MVYAVQGLLAFQNAARRNTVSSTIQTRLAQNVPWGGATRVDGTTQAGDPSVNLTVRFQTQAEADSFWADVQAAVGTGVNGPVVGSYIQRHDCPHDQGSGSACVISQRVDW